MEKERAGNRGKRSKKKKVPRIYLVRRDIEKPFGPDNWYMFKEAEFCRFKETEEFRKCPRYFAQIDACESGEEIVVAECSKEKSLELERVRAEERYRRELFRKSGITIVSYEGICCSGNNDHEDICGLESMADPDANVEDTVITREMYRSLHDAVGSLPQKSRDAIEDLFLRESPLSEKQRAEKICCEKHTVHHMKRAALEQLREKMMPWKDGECDE